ncbi:MAG: hypothetical protein KY445_16365 [Armatimonadetes bacterium]|nr:hypothetical protein [Armatimonadota bacterium]
MTASSSRRPLSRGEKWLLGFSMLLLAGFVGVGLFATKINTAPAIVFPTPLPRPTPNGYDFYVASARAMKPATPPVDAVNDSQNLLETNPQLAAKNYSLARKTAWLRANATAFALFQKGIATPCLHPDARVGGSMVAFGSYGSLRELARAKMIETHAFALQKRWNDAVNSSLDTVQMGSDMARGGALIGKLVGTAIVAIGRDPLNSSDFLPEKLNGPQSRAAAKRLESILRRRASYRDVLQEARWVSLNDFARFSQNPKWRDISSDPNATWRQKVEARLLSKDGMVQGINESFDAQIADISQPYNSPSLVKQPDNLILDSFVVKQSLRPQEGREIVPLNVLLLRFALRAYQLENGAFPASLNQLAPKYLQKVPTDYYADGAEFRYRIKNGDYELWSVGPDGKDNGGVPIKWRDGKVGVNKNGRFPMLTPESTGDYVARRNR